LKRIGVKKISFEENKILHQQQQKKNEVIWSFYERESISLLEKVQNCKIHITSLDEYEV